ncbi:MAG: ATP-grasp domain-containing protein [Spirochaetaceae bacterium]
MKRTQHVFVIGAEPFNMERLEHLPAAETCEFHSALDLADIRHVDEYDMEAIIRATFDNIKKAGVSADAVVAYFDFPASTLLPIVAQRFGLRGPTVRSVLKCENKFWSRIEQRRVAVENIPQFQAFDPHNPEALTELNLLYPFWVKPIKSFRSYLAFHVNDEREFAFAVEQMRHGLEKMNRPFQYLMERYRMPEPFTHMSESAIAESMLSGRQCTLEGYVFEGEVIGYGVIDTVREADRSSFSRYEYPSSLPLDVQYRMIEIARRVITQLAVDDSPFNMEFFYNQTQDHIYLLEVNPRISQSHVDMFQKVHGYSHQQVMIDIALGRRPAPMERSGPYRVAANFMIRVFEDGVVTRVPTREDMDSVRDAFPNADFKIAVTEGQQLSTLESQDSYSYEIANIFLGANTRGDLLQRYDRALEMLRFEVDGHQVSSHPAL